MSEALVNRSRVNRSIAAAQIPGWFGKMPHLGDFVSRRLPDEFVRGWDDWLQRGMACARLELEAEWLGRYLVAPVRRFWLAPGLLGHGAWAGVLMPSVDGVGRYFPLTIAAPLAPRENSLAVTLACAEWFRAIDAAARKALDVNFSADDLEDELATLPPLPLDAARDVEAARIAEVLLDAAESHFRSVWWCDDAAPASRLECFAALPPANAFKLLLAEPG
jgi:type VI secretion system protein ImpM